MELQARKLSTNIFGDDVALLHVSLQKLGSAFKPTKLKKQRFGRTIGEAVRAL